MLCVVVVCRLLSVVVFVVGVVCCVLCVVVVCSLFVRCALFDVSFLLVVVCYVRCWLGVVFRC